MDVRILLLLHKSLFPGVCETHFAYEAQNGTQKKRRGEAYFRFTLHTLYKKELAAASSAPASFAFLQGGSFMSRLRCALYPRVSTEEQLVHGLSLPAQIKDLTEYAQRMNYEIVDIYADEGVSARKPVSKRPALLRLLADVEAGKIDLILVTKLDRWFRNIREYQTTQEILERNNCCWKTIFEDYDTSTANGQMVVNIMLAVAQNECDRTSERIKTVLEHKVRNGEHVTGAAPYGYVSVGKKLQKDPETAEIVADIFRFYFSCFSKRQTVACIENKYNGCAKKPSVSQIERVLSAELYAGVYRGIADYYPAYITQSQYRVMQSAADTKRYPQTKEPYVFSGLILCPACGKPMTGFRKKHTRKDGSVTYYKRYRCSQKYARHASSQITERLAEADMLTRLCGDSASIACTMRRRPAAPNRIPGLRAELDRLNLQFQKGRITAAYYDRQYESLAAALDMELEQTNGSNPQIENLQSEYEEFCGDWQTLYRKLDTAHRNAFWKRIVKEIQIDKTTHKISGFSLR